MSHPSESGGEISGALGPELLRGTVAALGAAFLFGASTPAAKTLLPGTEPLMLGALLYLGAGFGVSLVRLVRSNDAGESPLRRSDLAILLVMIGAGAVAAPLLLLTGLRHVSAVTGSLVLNLEGPLTVLLAVLFWGEWLDGGGAAGAVLVMLGAAALTVIPGATLEGDAWGVAAVAGACFGWAVDNNLSQRLSLRDPVAVVQAKGLLGGGTAFVLALVFGNPLPPLRTVCAALLVGFLSYGVSVVLALHAMRLIGIARQAVFFATAPFIGVVVGVVVLGEAFGLRELVAMSLIIVGLALLMRERHSHVHEHLPMEHAHRHVHDAHHQHEHAPGDQPGEPHAHLHTHARLAHAHPHVSDSHHRHRH